MMENLIMLEELIKEGQEIRGTITFIQPRDGVMRLYSAYRNPDTQKYGAWKNKAIRYLDMKFPGNRCANDFESAINSFEKNHNSPSKLDDAIGVLISCQDVMKTIGTNDSSVEQEISQIAALEKAYKNLTSGSNSANTQDAIDAFHKWYDTAVRFLGKHFEESDTSYKQILDIDAGGNGYVLHSEFNRICSKVHLLLDKASCMGNVDRVSAQKKPSLSSDKIFIVHGHDNEMKESVSRLISSLGLEPIILSEQPDKGRTIIEKFADEANVEFAIVLMSDNDDYGAAIGDEETKPRARQNVILELGYFIGKLGRKNHVCVLKKDNVEVPSDILGIVYKQYDPNNDSWKFALGKELRAAGYNVDLNSI